MAQGKKIPRALMRQYVQYQLEGKSNRECCILLFDVTQSRKDGGNPAEIDEKKMQRSMYKLGAWRKTADYKDLYESMEQDLYTPLYNRAMNKISNQMEDPNPWVANKAANDILREAGGRLHKNDSNVVTVRIEGGPDIGSPEVDEQVALPETSSVYAEGNVE